MTHTLVLRYRRCLGPATGEGRILSIAAGLFLLALWLPTAARADDLNEQFHDRIQPLLETYCLDCHGQEGPEADLNLAAFTSAQQVRDKRSTWLEVAGQLRAGGMPPQDADQPAEDERTYLLQWIDSTINQVDCTGRVTPGHVTLRRLNRNEYRHTVRDLLGVDYQLADDFPADDVGYGFDNIGDVLSLPPLLMEKYLTAAEDISRQAIVTPASPPAFRHQINGEDLQGYGSSAGGSVLAMSSNGEAFAEFEFPADGQYQLRVQAAGDQAGPEPAKMAIRLDGRDICLQEVTATRDAPATHGTRLQVQAGKRKVGVAFTNDYYQPDASGGPQDRNLYVVSLEVRGPLGLAAEQLPDTHRRIVIVEPSEQTSEQEAARQIVTRLASAAYRRPAEPREIEQLLGLVQLADQQGDSFEAGIQLALQALLVSPHFLFRVESDPVEQEEVRTLNDFELATRLSYFLWSSMPDEELFTLARAGALRRDDNLPQQVRRMLADPKSQAFVESFAGQWLQLRSLEDRTFDHQRFPDCDRELLAAMRAETTQFFGEVVRQDMNVLRILDADFTYVNEALARHYGMEGISGPELRRVSLRGTPRAGILTHGSILAVTSNPTRTSPVKRGKFVLENLLGTPPPAPPADVPELDDAGRQLTGTLRQRLEQHRSDPGCAACHKLMDPIGFALEHFDAVGRYREEDDGAPIDTAGELPSGERFAGLPELRELLLNVKRDDFLQCLVEKTLTYAVGRGLEYYDQCAVDKVKNAMELDDYRFSRLVLEVVKSEPFQKQAKKRSPE